MVKSYLGLQSYHEWSIIHVYLKGVTVIVNVMISYLLIEN